MTLAQDRAEAEVMKDHLEKYGVEVRINIIPGAGGSTSLGTHRLIMSHHTASRRSQGLTPARHVVINGRPDVPGPLANGYGGYDLVYEILTFGRANHPGAGGPVTFDGVRVPKDQGRPYIWGTEFEGGYEPYTPEMHDFMARANAGLTSYFAARKGATVEANLEHKDWAPTRKVDRFGYTRASSIARIRAVMNNPTTTTSPEEDDMFDSTDRFKVTHTFNQLTKLVNGALVASQNQNMLRTLQGQADGILAAVAQISAGEPVDLDAVREAARSGAQAAGVEQLDAIRAALLEALAGHTGDVDPEEVADAVVDELVSRLQTAGGE